MGRAAPRDRGQEAGRERHARGPARVLRGQGGEVVDARRRRLRRAAAAHRHGEAPQDQAAAGVQGLQAADGVNTARSTMLIACGMMRRIKIAIVCFGFLLIALGAISRPESETGNWCEQQWGPIAQPFDQGEKKNYDDLLKAWQQYEGKCKGTGVYEARLGQTYILLNRIDDAKK